MYVIGTRVDTASLIARYARFGKFAVTPRTTLDRPRIVESTQPLVLYCLGHLMVDLYSASLGVLQPALIETFGLSLTQAGVLGGVLALSASVLQPVYGILADRFHSRLFRRWHRPSQASSFRFSDGPTGSGG